MTNKRLLEEIKKYEGKSVEDFLGSDLAEFIGIDIWQVNSHEIGWGEDYTPDYRTIKYINIRNVMGYMIADLTTEEVAA